MGFISGLRLSERFYWEAVRPILDSEFPALAHSAALIGYGSQVVGYDTARSTDHEWGPRLLLFLSEDDHAASHERPHQTLRQKLPPHFLGFSTHFGPPDAEGVRQPTTWTAGPIEHKIEVMTVRAFFTAWIGIDPSRELEPVDWLTLPEQKLLEVTAGRVYHDGLGALHPIRARLAYYPRDVWLCLLAAQWRRIAQNEALVGRAAEVGDELGSRLVAAIIVRDLMRLCFLIERRYAPYGKWLGTAFVRLACAPTLAPLFNQVLAAEAYRRREEHLAQVYTAVAELHNGLGLTAPLETAPSHYYGRPHLVIHGERFAEALESSIANPRLHGLSSRVGSVNQLTDCTVVLQHAAVYNRLRHFYEQLERSELSGVDSGS